MTLGELHDALAEIDEAERDLDAANLSIQHGGSDETMKGKRETFWYRQDELKRLRDQEIDLTITI